ncbi:MAG: SGNH/GDSL hydrolase family protein [bacterium]
MIIHCIGDSHANFFSGYDEMQPEWPAADIRNRLPFFRSYRIGPVLAYNLGRYGTTTMGREKLERLLTCLNPGSHILFCFGEIDCRAHISLQSQKQKRSPETVIAEVVEKYGSVILHIRQMGFQPLVWNVIPSAPTTINSRIRVPPRYLFHGSCSERNRITRTFNLYLKALTQTAGIKFLNIFDQLLLDDGSVNRSFYSDDIHLSQKAMPLVLASLNDMFQRDAFKISTQSPSAAEAVFLSPFV